MRIKVVISGLLEIPTARAWGFSPCPALINLNLQDKRGGGSLLGSPFCCTWKEMKQCGGAEVLMKVSPVFLKFGAIDRLPTGGGGDCSMSYSLKALSAHGTFIGGQHYLGRQKWADTQVFADKGTREMVISALTSVTGSLCVGQSLQPMVGYKPFTVDCQVLVLMQTLLFFFLQLGYLQ